METQIKHNNEHLNSDGIKLINIRFVTAETVEKAKELDARLLNYFGHGGLFNPEAMEHDKVRGLLLDLHTFVREIRGNYDK